MKIINGTNPDIKQVLRVLMDVKFIDEICFKFGWKEYYDNNGPFPSLNGFCEYLIKNNKLRQFYNKLLKLQKDYE